MNKAGGGRAGTAGNTRRVRRAPRPQVGGDSGGLGVITGGAILLAAAPAAGRQRRRMSLEWCGYCEPFEMLSGGFRGRLRRQICDALAQRSLLFTLPGGQRQFGCPRAQASGFLTRCTPGALWHTSRLATALYHHPSFSTLSMGLSLFGTHTHGPLGLHLSGAGCILPDFLLGTSLAIDFTGFRPFGFRPSASRRPRGAAAAGYDDRRVRCSA